MSKYTRQDLIDMEDDELEVVYEEILEKSYPSTKKRKDIVSEILAAQKEKEEEEEEERVSEKKKKTSTAPKAAPVSSVRSTLLKTKSPLKSKAPQVVLTVDPLLVSQGLVEEELMPEEEQQETEKQQTKRGRPPKKIEKLSLSTSSEEIEKYKPPTKTLSETSRVDTILERIKKSAKVDLLNPKASFQKGDVIREREPTIATPIVVDANLVSIELPVHEEAKKSITDFLHDIGALESSETVPSPKKVVTPKKKGGPVVSVDEELERLASQQAEQQEPEEEDFFTLGEPVSVVKSVEPVSKTLETIKPGKQEKSMTKSIKEILEQEEADQLEEELRFAKEKEVEAEKERELEKRTQEEAIIKKKISRRPVVVQETTAEGEEVGEPEEQVTEQVTERVLDSKEEELRKELLRSPSKWKNVELLDIPLTEFKSYKPRKTKTPTKVAEPLPSSKKKEKKEMITTEIEEPQPLVIKKTLKKTEVKETPSGRKDVVKSVREQIESVAEEPEEEPKSKPSSKKKKPVTEEQEEQPKSKPSSKKKKAAEQVDILPILQQVDRSRMASGRGKNLYGIKDLQDILRQLPGVKISGKKEELIGRLDEELNKYGL